MKQDNQLKVIMLITIVLLILSYSQAKKIVVVGDDNFPPFEFINESGVYTGFNVDMIKAIAEQKNLEIEIIPMRWEDAKKALLNGSVDLIQGIQKTPEREANYSFSNSFLITYNEVFLIRGIKNINSIENLTPFVVVVQKSDVVEEYFKKNYPHILLYEADNQEKGLLELVSGDYKVFSGDYYTTKYLIKKHRLEFFVKEAGLPFLKGEYCMAVKKGDEDLLTVFNEGLSEIKENGKYDEIYIKWFGSETRFISINKILYGFFALSTFLAFVATISLLVLRKFKKTLDKRTSELRKTQKELREYNKKLEKIINERTSELRKIIRNLKIKEKRLENSKKALLNITEDLNNALEELKELDKLKTQFLSTTSHELRTPMTPMKAQLQMLLKGYFGRINKKQEESIKLILKNTERLDSLIKEVLDVSRIQAKRLKIFKRKNDLNKVVKEAINLMKPRIKEKNLKLKVNLAELPRIYFDKDKITQVIINLLDNAIKFTPKGSIIIETRKFKESVRVRIKDTGIGIPEKIHSELFKPFVQADSSASRQYGGTGLGLSICKGIIEAHQGRIWFESKEDRGTTFYFTLPIIKKKI